MSIPMTRRNLLQAAMTLPAGTLFGQADRRTPYLKAASAAKTPVVRAMYVEAAKLASGQAIDPAAFEAVLEFFPTRRDLVDFTMAGMMRVLFLYGNDPRIPDSLKARMKEAVLDFRPWLYPEDKPVKTVACYWTENHQALYSSIEYLAGQLYPEETFRWLGKPGSWHKEHGRKNLLVWLGLRARYGMSEWLSPTYYAEDILALMNLVDFAHDSKIAKAAQGITEMLLLDGALHAFDAGMRNSSGRSYLNDLKDARKSETAAILSVACGLPDTGVPLPLSGAAIALATSPRFRTPEAIVRIAHTRPQEVLIHEKSGFSPEEALQLGFRPEDPADIMTFWTMQAYTHPRVFHGNVAACRRWNIDRYTAESWDAKEEEFQKVGGDPARVADNSATAMFGANVETYRTPDYQVSTAQDYRKGKPGFQQQIFLASLGGAASVWVSHPGADTEAGRPSYWIGNGFLPRAAQHKNLAILLYKIPAEDTRPFTHVYFPVAEFEEVREEAGWLFGRKGDGYIAVTARPGLKASRRAEYAKVERISDARESVWICRLGSKAHDESFATFVEQVGKAVVEGEIGHVAYREAGGGLQATFGWDEDFVVNGRKIALSGYARYDTPFVKTERGSQIYQIACEGRTHTIDLSGLKVRPFRETL